MGLQNMVRNPIKATIVIKFMSDSLVIKNIVYFVRLIINVNSVLTVEWIFNRSRHLATCTQKPIISLTILLCDNVK